MQNQPPALYAAASVKFPALSVAGLDNFPIMEVTKIALCVAVMDKQNVRDVMALAKSKVPYFTGVCQTPKNVTGRYRNVTLRISERPFMLIKFEGT
jgi:hypothetical protein